MYLSASALIMMKRTHMKTYTVMIADGGGSEVYISGVTLEHAENLVAANKKQNEVKYTGSVLYIRELKK
jgi:hypothetical protein